MATCAMNLPSTSAFSGPALRLPDRMSKPSSSLAPLKARQFPGQHAFKSNPARTTCFTSSSAQSSLQAEALPNFYSLLELDQTVETSQIKTAYRRMALKYHPDVSPPESRELNTKKFMQVQDAYTILSDPDSRRDYDLFLKQKLSGHTGRVGGWEPSSRSRGGRSEVEVMTDSWKAQWEAQVERLQTRNRDRMSWGCRMRCS